MRLARFARAAAVCLAATAPAATATAIAQDNPHPPRTSAPAPADPHATSLKIRALDLSAMYDASAGGTKEPGEIPLASRPVKALFPGASGPSSLDLMTDADGRLEMPLAGIAAGTQVEFIVPDPEATDRWPLYASLPVTVGEAPPDGLVFVRVHDGDNPLTYSTYFLTATAPDREEGNPSLRVNLIAAVENRGERLWIGPRNDMGRGTLRFRIPKDFTMVLAQVAGRDAKPDLVPRGDGAVDVVLRERIWPTAFSGQPTGVRIVLSGPYRETAPYDFSFKAEVPIDEFRANLEQGVISYVASGDVELEDAGANPPIAGKVTDAWRTGHVHTGQEVGVKFEAGSRIHPRVWLTLGTLAFVVAGAVFLARALSKRTGSPGGPGPARAARAPAPPLDERADRLRELDRRLAKGEISSFEHAARKKQIEGGLRAPPSTSPARPTAPSHGARNALDEISGRVDAADAETLRRDVRSLLAMLRSQGK